MTPIYDTLCDETLVFPHNNEPPTGPIPVIPHWQAVDTGTVGVEQ